MAEEAAELLLQEGQPAARRVSGQFARPSGMSATAGGGAAGRSRPHHAVVVGTLRPRARRNVRQRRPPVCDAAHVPFQLIDRGATGLAEISVVDRLSGTIVDTLHVPTPYRASSQATVAQVGHFLPVGSRGALHGMTLLDRSRQVPLWTNAPRRNRPRSGGGAGRSERPDVFCLPIARPLVRRGAGDRQDHVAADRSRSAVRAGQRIDAGHLRGRRGDRRPGSRPPRIHRVPHGNRRRVTARPAGHRVSADAGSLHLRTLPRLRYRRRDEPPPENLGPACRSARLRSPDFRSSPVERDG